MFGQVCAQNRHNLICYNTIVAYISSELLKIYVYSICYSIAQYIYLDVNNKTIHCVFSNSCGALIGGCMVTLISQTDGTSINQTKEVVGGSNVVEVSLKNLELSESYNYTARFISWDMMTPVGRSFSGIIPAMTLNNTTSYSSVYSTQSVMPTISKNPAVSTATSLPRTRLTSTIIKPMQSTSTGNTYMHVLFACTKNN